MFVCLRVFFDIAHLVAGGDGREERALPMQTFKLLIPN